MSIAVKVIIGAGSFDRGFRVRSQLSLPDKILDSHVFQRQQGEDRLTTPSLSDLPNLYEEWRLCYRQIARNFCNDITIPPQITHESDLIADCRDAQVNLEQLLDKWFNSFSFEAIRGWIVAHLKDINQSKAPLPVAFEIDTGDSGVDNLLRKLPWDRWRLFDRHNLLNAEVILNTYTHRSDLRLENADSRLENPVRIFAILGSTERLNLTEDFAALRRLAEKYGAKITLLPTDTRVSLDQLREKLGDKIEIIEIDSGISILGAIIEQLSSSLDVLFFCWPQLQ